MQHHAFARLAACAVAAALCLAAPPGARAHDQSHGHPGAAAAAPAAVYPREAPFLAENAAAMDKMMAEMDVKPTGDIDADFVAMMVPHHQGAIDMALAVLRYGKNEQIRRLAQEIIVTQQQEIAAMRLALGQPLPPSAAAPTQVSTKPAEPTPHAHGPSATSHGPAPAMQMK
ncbi:DUF305 domain-containing protein [Bosea sp. 2KB_26]|uniref:DUF305 domain-containing protein n=1 Tax=Bosea sp. 2KB_26 TaxID=3237475 RepID=UPI003F8E2C1B